ncbi:MAG: histidinol-phosphatase HisJ family protein [Peptococcaceae bacterium]|nr:histidinol-phosphatase HisJ family protein [Peptococcaceae bacterium]
MILADCHVHSCFSSDAETPVEQMIETAIAQGRKYFYLTDHHDFDYPVGEDGRDFQLPREDYTVRLEQLKDQYADKIELRIGVEMGLMAHISDKINEYVSGYPFDFIIGSSHLVHGQDPYYAEYYEGKTEKQAYEEYFLSILENAKALDCFHVYGHLDYVIRYGPNKDRFYNPMDYYDVFKELLTVLIDKGKGIEVNTGSLYKGFTYPHPHETVLKLYRQLGGEIVTIGSDAHVPQYLGYGFDAAEALLKRCGFHHYTLFKQGRPQQIVF